MSGNVAVSIYEVNGYDQVDVRAGRQRGRIVCEGQPWEREVFDWDHRIEVTVSPTGRSVRVFIDGTEYGPSAAGGVSGEPSTQATENEQ